MQETEVSVLGLIAQVPLEEFGTIKNEVVSLNMDGIKASVKAELGYRNKLRRNAAKDVSEEDAAASAAAATASSAASAIEKKNKGGCSIS